MKREYWGDEEETAKQDNELYEEYTSEDEELEGMRDEINELEEEPQSDEEFRKFKRTRIEKYFGEDIATEAFEIEDALKEAFGEGQSDSEDNEDDGIAELDEIQMEKVKAAKQRRQTDVEKDDKLITDEVKLWALKSIYKVMEGRRQNDETVQQTLQRLNLERKKKMKRSDRKKRSSSQITITNHDPSKILNLENSTFDEQIAVVVEAVDILEKDENFKDILNWTRNEIFESRGFVKSYKRSQDSTW